MRFYLRRVRLNAGGYEPGKYGRYFGVGRPLYYFESEDGTIDGHFRATDRSDAVAMVKAGYDGAVVRA